MISPPSVMGLPPLWAEARVPAELLSLRRDPVWDGEGVDPGDGQPVLLICGFLAGDPSLRLLAAWLKRMGHRPVRAGLRWNVGCSGETVDRLEQLIEALAAEHGRPVALVGQSRGGTCARILAVRRPDLVDRVVTLGSPLLDQFDIHPLVWAQVHLLGLLGTVGRVPGLMSFTCREGECCAQVNRELSAPFPSGVTLTSVYSRSDGIVRWRACLDPAARWREVQSSHIGMAWNAAAYREIGAALAPIG
jgi:triacylglycerol lipase